MRCTMNFDGWVVVPDGPVTLAAGGYLVSQAAVGVASFFIARHPVTNSQFQRFVDAGGYMTEAHWCPDGWRLRQRDQWTAPRFYADDGWRQPDCPVVGVSWYEAMAYCRWLSSRLGRTVTLPSEAQWQRAAQGDDGRPFPWGDQHPTVELCNWGRQFDEPTPVDWHPAGASPYGVWGMSGNVWEYCLEGYDSGDSAADRWEPRVLRGGSWSSDSPISLTVDNRSWKDPNARLVPDYRHHTTVGFRPVAL